MVSSVAGHEASIQALLGAGARIDQTGNEGVTALKLAVQHGRIQAVQTLLNAGATVDMTAVAGGQTALMWAAMSGHLPIARLLLQAGADPNLETHLGYKALDYAKDKKDENLIKLLRTASKAAVQPRKKLFRKLFG